ncbi:MAG: response regulator, partial [bacterium]|nr:response regulator [bacterium]
VVEDENGIRALMRKILQKQGYNVLEASRGDEALQISRQHKAPIHLLLTDVVMPQMSGRELADQLKTERPDIKVLFVSGYTDEDLLEYGPLPAGAAFLQKPFSLAALLEKTRAVLNNNGSAA